MKSPASLYIEHQLARLQAIPDDNHTLNNHSHTQNNAINREGSISTVESAIMLAPAVYNTTNHHNTIKTQKQQQQQQTDTDTQKQSQPIIAIDAGSGTNENTNTCNNDAIIASNAHTNSSNTMQKSGHSPASSSQPTNSADVHHDNTIEESKHHANSFLLENNSHQSYTPDQAPVVCPSEVLYSQHQMSEALHQPDKHYESTMHPLKQTDKPETRSEAISEMIRIPSAQDSDVVQHRDRNNGPLYSIPIASAPENNARVHRKDSRHTRPHSCTSSRGPQSIDHVAVDIPQRHAPCRIISKEELRRAGHACPECTQPVRYCELCAALI